MCEENNASYIGHKEGLNSEELQLEMEETVQMIHSPFDYLTPSFSDSLPSLSLSVHIPLFSQRNIINFSII